MDNPDFPDYSKYGKRLELVETPPKSPTSPQETTDEQVRAWLKSVNRKARRALWASARRDTRRKNRADHRKLRMARLEDGSATWRIEVCQAYEESTPMGNLDE